MYCNMHTHRVPYVGSNMLTYCACTHVVNVLLHPHPPTNSHTQSHTHSHTHTVTHTHSHAHTCGHMQYIFFGSAVAGSVLVAIAAFFVARTLRRHMLLRRGVRGGQTDGPGAGGVQMGAVHAHHHKGVPQEVRALLPFYLRYHNFRSCCALMFRHFLSFFWARAGGGSAARRAQGCSARGGSIFPLACFFAPLPPHRKLARTL